MILEKIVSNDIKEITIKYLSKKLLENTAQRIIVQNFLNKIKIYKDDGEIIYKNYITVKLNKEAKEEILLEKEKYLSLLKNEKKFLVDLSLYKLHSKAGKKSLEIQVAHALKEIREFLYDRNLILIGDLDFSFLGKNEVKIYKKREDFPFEKFKPVILDPYAEDTLTEKDLKKYDLFLIGGIVDVGQKWIGATSYLFRDLDFDKKKIVLGDSITGVPDRINILIKILLECIYLSIPLEIAIVKNQTKKDILERLNYEIRKLKSNNTIKEEDLDKILKYVNTTKEFLIKFLKEKNIKII